MKMILPLVLIVMCCSCNTYQYITVSSPDIKQNTQHQFETENDTMKLVYDFSGRFGPVKLTVFNKLSKPMIIDFNRSALIVNGKAVSFNSGKVELTANLNASTVNFSRGVSGTSGVINGVATLPAGMVFIPAGTYVTQTPLVIADKNLDNIPDDKLQRERFNVGQSDQYSLKTAHFTQDGSPLVFKSYITFVLPDSDKTEFTRQHSFFVSKVNQTTVNPSNLPYDASGGDQFYVSKMNSGAYAAGWTVGLAAAIAVAAVASNNQSTNK